MQSGPAPTQEPPLRIDILVPMPHPDDRLPKDCKEQSASPSENADGDGKEIVVCGERGDNSAYYWSGSREAAEDRIARETAYAGDISPPDVAGAGIFRGPATVGGLCGFLFNPCPPPVAIMIDLEAIEESPPGSDADRVARGLAPADKGDMWREELPVLAQDELGLPPALGEASKEGSGTDAPESDPGAVP